jgi:hypothetical protein
MVRITPLQLRRVGVDAVVVAWSLFVAVDRCEEY